MSISAWRHYRPVKHGQSCRSYASDDPNSVDLSYHVTGRCWDLLRDLAEAGSFPESHASPPANNNKRTHGSDEPAESPPPDNTSKASSNGRGPIASSKWLSSSRGSSPRDVTSVLNDTTTSSPIPEKTDGLEASNSSSPGTLTRIFDGDAMPITTNDLGRLPLHHGVEFPTNFYFGQVTNGWNATGSEPSLWSSQGGPNTRGTQTGVIPGLHPPQEQHLEDLFPWMLCTTAMGGKEIPTDSVSTLATVATATKPNVASTHVAANPDQTRQTVDRLDSTISSLFGGVPSSFTAFGQTADLLPGPTSNTTEDHTDLFGALFPPFDPQVGSHPPTTVQNTQQPYQGPTERGYGSLPIDAQAYLHGWSNVPQAFE